MGWGGGRDGGIGGRGRVVWCLRGMGGAGEEMGAGGRAAGGKGPHRGGGDALEEDLEAQAMEALGLVDRDYDC